MTLAYAFTFEETPESRSTTAESHTRIYKACGQTDDNIVYAYAINNTGLTVTLPHAVMFRKDVQLEPDGFAQYKVTVSYETPSKTPPRGEFTFSFDTTGATVNVACGLEHIKSYPVDGDWHKGALRVKGDGEVEGADIIIPALKLTYSIQYEMGTLTEAFAVAIARATGRVNTDAWHGFQPGELLFAGGTGSDGTNAPVKLDYQFIASENITGLTIGTITGIAHAGHDYVWAEFEDVVFTGEAVRRTKRVHVDRVYRTLAFNSQFPW